MDRRTFITASSALPLAGAAIPAIQAAGQIDPLRVSFNAWSVARAAWLETEEGSDQDKAVWAEMERAEAHLCGTVAETADGIAAQLQFLIEDAGNHWAGPSHETLAGNLLAASRNLAKVN